MKIKEINNILDQEIKFSRETPLADTLDENFVDGFIKGLTQARYLLNAAAKVDLEGSLEKDPNYLILQNCIKTNAEVVKSAITRTPFTSGYLWVVPEPIPNLNKILEKYDGIIITGPRGSGKTTTALKVIDYMMGTGKSKRGMFIFPTAHYGIDTMTSEKYSGILSAAYYPDYKYVEWDNKSVGNIFSSENALELRGYQSGILWFEEIDNFRKSSPNILDIAYFANRLEPRKYIITGTDYKEAMKDTWLEKLNLYTYNLNMPI